MTRWVVDASPLIFLAKLERLALLHQSSDEVYVPPQVLEEIRAQRDSSVGAIEQAVPRLAARQGAASRLRAHGFRASDELVRGGLEEAGEWESEA